MVKFLLHLLLVFSSRISFWFVFCNLYFFIDNLYLILVALSLYSFYIVPFISLNIFQMADLKSLSSNSNVWAS